MSPPCPPPEALARLGGRSLDAGDDAFRDLEAHVASCGACRDRLERLARLDTTGWAAPPAAGPGRPPEVPGCVMGPELGRGGSGVVYEAVQARLGRRVAVKVPAASLTADAGSRARWLREARAHARVRHPNIVRLYEAGEHEGRLYLILDLVPGGSLRDRARGPIPPREAARIVEAVARAVGAIHRAGLLHLDVKPSNILLDGPPDGGWAEQTPLLADFGLAREGDDDRPGARPGGTPAYMAPEQRDGPPAAIGPAADVYALGATLYALLAGRPPRGASGRGDGDGGPPPPLRASAPGVPRDLETIARACLAAEPAGRYASADDLADDLRRWLDGFPIRARPASPIGRLARWGRRRPAAAALAAALALTTIVALAGLAALWRRAERERARAESALATADGAVADLLGLLRDAIGAPERSTNERGADATEAVLALTAKLRRAPGPAARRALAVAGLVMALSQSRDRSAARDDSLRLLDDAADLLAGGGETPPPEAGVEVAARFAEVVLCLGQILAQGPRWAEAEAPFLRAERALAPFAADPRTLDVLLCLNLSRAQLALRMREQGEPEAARRTLRANAAFFRGLLARADGPMMRLIVGLAEFEEATRGLSTESPEAAEAVWLAHDRLPRGTPIPPGLYTMLADLTASGLGDAAEAAPDPASAAARVLDGLREREAGRRLPPSFRDAVFERVSQLGCLSAVAHRRAGRLDDARRTTAWMAALARALAASEPGSVEARLVLSRAFEQDAKIAWSIDEPDDAERALRSALAEAATAFALAPDDERCRRLVAGLREKFARLVAPQDPGARERTQANDAAGGGVAVPSRSSASRS